MLSKGDEVMWAEIGPVGGGGDAETSVHEFHGSITRIERGTYYCTPRGGGCERAVQSSNICLTAAELREDIVEELERRKKRIDDRFNELLRSYKRK